LPKQKSLKKNKHSVLEASVKWTENSQSYTFLSENIYLSDQLGIDSRRRVFFDGNDFAKRWGAEKNLSFTIGETGFGAGLNFLITAEAWLKYRGLEGTGILNFVSAENSPLPKKDLIRILSLAPEFSELANDLIEYYPPPISGIHRLYFKDKKIVLTLMYGDAYEMLSSIKNTEHPFFERENNPIFDAWFLDGFSPKNNPDIWSAEVFKVIANLSQPGTTFSASTTDNFIKERLIQAGFSSEIITHNKPKIGYVRGQLIDWKNKNIPKKSWNPALFNSPYKAPWYLTPEIKKPSKAIVIGGGIAGCSTARALAERGISVTLIERHRKVAQEASGNAQGVLYPKLSSSISEISRFSISSLMVASKFYKSFLDNKQSKIYGDRCGVIILPKKSDDIENFKRISSVYPDDFVRLIINKELDKKAGLPLSSRFGLFFPQLGWISPAEACRWLVEHPSIFIKNAEVEDIQLKKISGSKEESWVALDDMKKSLETADIVVIACSFESKKFNQTNYLPLTRVRGQTTAVPANNKTSRLKTVLCGKSYFLPMFNDAHTLGATYKTNENQTSNLIEDHEENITQLNLLDQSLAENFDPVDASSLDGRTSFRCTTPDFLPIVGPAPKLNDYLKDYKLMKKNARSHIPTPGGTWKGLYLNIGHGSKGLSYAPICADLIASQVFKEVPPLELDLRRAIHPGRFIIRDIKRNKL
jgi:tRNA 5-methylaminomethyl-2-thiouridine biosynthesis bifunctional protein